MGKGRKAGKWAGYGLLRERVYEVPVDRKPRKGGHVAPPRKGKSVILPCVTRITRAAFVKSARQTSYRGNVNAIPVSTIPGLRARFCHRARPLFARGLKVIFYWLE